MRPRLVEALAPLLGDRVAAHVVPVATTLLLAAIAAVLVVMLARTRRAGLERREVVAAAACGVLCGLVGARLFHVLLHLGTEASPAFRLAGGTASWGGYVGGLLGFGAYLRARREPLLRHADLLASALGLGPAISRWGCLMAGCCWGREGHPPWAIRFPAASSAHASQVAAGRLDPAAALSLPVHPVQAYASLAGLLVFAAASVCWHRRRDRPGVTFALFWSLYGALRFVTEFFRGDVPRDGPLPLTLSQYLAAGVAVAATLLLVMRIRRTRRIQNR